MLDHEQLHRVVVTNVLLSNDSKNCRILVEATPEIIQELNTKHIRVIQHAFRSHYARKIVPRLEFVADDGTGMAIDALLSEVEKER